MKGKYRVLNGFTNNYRSFNSREEIEDKFSKTSYLTDEKPPKNVIDIDTSEDERAKYIDENTGSEITSSITTTYKEVVQEPTVIQK